MKQPVSPLPSISAIVVTYHSGPVLKECLYALYSEPGLSEVVIVNNGNHSADEAWLEAFTESKRPYGCRLITGHGNIGFAAAVNLGAKHAQSACYLIINPDAVIRIGSLPPLEAARRTGRAPCLVGGRLFYPTGNEQRGGRRELLTLPRAIFSFTGLSKLEKTFPAFRDLHREHDPEPTGPVPMPVISGAFCYISAPDYNAINGFDEDYFLHVEDIDLCRRIADAGGEVIYTPHAGVMHYGSTSDVSASFVQWHKAKGLAFYFTKHSKSPAEKAVAQASIVFFAALLIGRSGLIRAGWWLKRQSDAVRRKLASHRKA